MKVIKEEVVKHPELGELTKKVVYEYDEKRFASLQEAINHVDENEPERIFFNKYAYSPPTININDLTTEDLQLLSAKLKSIENV